jgi:hypothetical protein
MKEMFKIIAVFFFTAIILSSCRGDLLYKKGKYSIRKKNIVSYYQASPDLFVNNDKGEVKINLNGFGKRLIAQEKITGIIITNITDDSVQIQFTASDTSLQIKEEFIGVNIKYAVDSILATGK